MRLDTLLHVTVGRGKGWCHSPSLAEPRWPAGRCGGEAAWFWNDWFSKDSASSVIAEAQQGARLVIFVASENNLSKRTKRFKIPAQGDSVVSIRLGATRLHALPEFLSLVH
ncbi:hypothetical protein E2C01_026167 [Portunus trituberculatus]|uniref:Uncharacterized protein n=1 Tax=Portunus trituberculatus TaxID=210409 RepID=A0A5B7EI32_PORTR|nr:hypothetical protein [Portunus trituberculatus]